MGIKYLFKIMEKPPETLLSKMAGKKVAVDVSILICRADAVQISPQRYVASQMLMLMECNLTPVVVFDGQSPEAKKECREARRQILKRKTDDAQEVKEEYSQTYSVRNSKVQNNLKTFCTNYGIEYIQSPCEADAQIAYLVLKGYVDFAITEDSDFLVFGCPKVLYKLKDKKGLLYDHDTIERSLGAPFDLSTFRAISICLGCDYLLKGCPNFGPAAAKAIYRDLVGNYSYENLIQRLHEIRRFKGIPGDFEQSFLRATNTFKYQLVLDPTSMKIVPLTPYEDGKSSSDYPYAGVPEQTQDEVDWIQKQKLGKLNMSDIKKVVSKNNLCCLKCNEILPSLPLLTSHYNEMHPILCMDCGQAFRSVEKLRLHVATHNQVRDYVCHKCQKAFKREIDLKAHYKRNPECELGVKENRTCDKCQKVFSLPCELRKHLERCKPKLVNKTCPRCGKTFENGSLNRHMKNVDCQPQTKPFMCEKCGSGFTKSGNLQKHLLKVTCQPPDENGLWKCNTCGKDFKLIQNLTQHLNGKGKCKPEGEKEIYACRICAKVLSGPKELKRHIGTMNCQRRNQLQEDDKPFKCGTCGRGFKTKQNCKRHEPGCQPANESGVWRYTCQYCQRGYNRLANMKTHSAKCPNNPTSAGA